MFAINTMNIPKTAINHMITGGNDKTGVFADMSRKKPLFLLYIRTLRLV